MKKMKTVFVVDYSTDTPFVTNVVREENEWVVKGEGKATIKFDGTSCLVRGGKLFKRYDRKLTKEFSKKRRKNPNMVIEEHMLRDAPEGFEPCEPTFDPNTGHWPGWLEVDLEDPANRWHAEAWSKLDFTPQDGTYELVGPKIGANPEGLDSHEFWLHGSVVVDVDPDFESLKKWLENNLVEGLVFHHPDGRMAKIRRKDFGFKW